MAIRASELLLIIRGQNQASAAIGRVARDLRALGTVEQAEFRRASARLQTMRNLQEQARAARRITTLEPGGTRALALQKAMLGNERQIANARARVLDRTSRLAQIEEQRFALTTRGIRVEAAMAQATLNRERAARRVARLGAGGAGGRRMAEAQEVLRIRMLREAAAGRDVEGLAGANARLTRATEAVTRSMQRNEAQIQALEADTARLTARKQDLIATLRIETAQLEVQQQAYKQLLIAEERAALAVERFPLERIRTIGRATAHVGRVTQMVGMVTTAAIGVAAVKYADFAKQATFAATQTGAIGESFDKVLDRSQLIQRGFDQNGRHIQGVLELMKQFPQTGEEMNQTLYTIYSSMNISFGGGLRLLKLFSQVATAGQAPLNDVADSLITVANNWRINTNNMGAWRRVATQTLATVRFGRMTLADYTAALNQLVPAFRSAHQNMLQMNAAFATVSRFIPSTRMAATGLARMMEVLQRAAAINPQFRAMVTDAQGNLLDLDVVIQRIIRRYPEITRSGVALTNFFKSLSNQQGTVQARRVFGIIIQNVGQYRQILSLIRGDQAEFNRELAAMQRTPGVRWQVMINQLRVMGLTLGEAVIPMLIQLTGWLQKVIERFNNLSPHTKRIIGDILAVSGVLTLFGGVIATIIGGITSLVATFMLWKMSRNIAELRGIVAGAEGAAGATVALRAGIIGLVIVLTPLVAKLIGWHDTLKALSILITTFSVAKIITGITGIGVTATVATGEVTLLQAALARLTFLGPIAIPITLLIYKKDIEKKADEAGNRFSEWLEKKTPKSDWFRKWILDPKMFQDIGSNTPVDQLLDRWLFKGKELEAIPGQLQKFLRTAKPPEAPVLGSIMTDPRAARKFEQEQARAAAAAIQLGAAATPTFQKLFSNMETAYKKAAAAGWTDLKLNLAYFNAQSQLQANVSKQQYQAAMKAAKQTETISDAEVYRRFQNTEKLKKQAQSLSDAHAPSPEVMAAWKRYYKALELLRNAATDQQMQAAQAVADAIEEVTPKISDAEFQRQMRAAEKLKPKPGSRDYAAWKRYYAALEAASKDASSAQSQAWEASNEAMQKDTKQTAEQMRSTFKGVVDKLQGIYDQFLEQNKSAFGELFQGPWIQGPQMQAATQFGGLPTVEDFIRDLNEQKDAFARFRGSIGTLIKQGLPRDMVTQLQQLGPEGQKTLDQIAGATPEQRKRLIAAFTSGQTLIRKAAAQDTARQIQHWYSFGKKVAEAIIKGVRSEEPTIEEGFRSLAAKLFPRLAKGAKVNIPGGGTYNETYTINVTSTESIEAALTRVLFRHRNRKRRK